MGVLESVDLKQKNFPFRRKFEEFYSEYEILSPRYATVRYYQMDKSAEDFESMAKEIISGTMAGQGREFYEIGNFKILMMPEIKTVLDLAKARAAEKRDYASNALKEGFNIYYGACLFRKQMPHI